MLCTMKELLEQAARRNAAVGAFSTYTMEAVKGIVQAAEQTQTPAILQIAESRFPYAPFELMAPMMVNAAKKASVPVAVHLDHGQHLETVQRALELGFTSVMIDGSRLPLEDNIRLTLKAKELAAARGATLEAEIGRVGGDEGMGQVRDSCTRPEEALAFWRQTGVDALAVAIGNAHGNYRFAPELQFDILETIRNTVDCPLVLHGGTGISFADFRRTIDLGVRKINIATALLDAQREAARESLRGGADPSYFAVSEHMTERIAQTVARHIGVFNNREPLSAIE